MNSNYCLYDASKLDISILSRSRLNGVENRHEFNYDRLNPEIQKEICRYVAYHVLINSQENVSLVNELRKRQIRISRTIATKLISDDKEIPTEVMVKIKS